jgi:hypothetical protein
MSKAVAYEYAKKGMSAVRRGRREKTQRTRGVSKLRQFVQSLCPESCIPHEFPNVRVDVFLGGSFNASWITRRECGYDLVLNCSSESQPVWDEGTVWMPIEDDNDNDLSSVLPLFHGACDKVGAWLSEDPTGRVRVLVHCFWGCSRSFALAILLLARLTRNYDYDHWSDTIIKARPFVDVSKTLEQQTRFILLQWREAAGFPLSGAPTECSGGPSGGHEGVLGDGSRPPH